jgi:hypothetical protein
MALPISFFTPGEFIEKLSAIIPPPKSHLVKWSGFFAPNSPCRNKIVRKPEERKGRPVKVDCTDESPLKNSSWGKMLAKVFEIDVTKCQHWKGEMSIVAAIIKCSEVARYLKHLGIEHEPPARAPPRYQQDSFEFGSTDDLYENMSTIDD